MNQLLLLQISSLFDQEYSKPVRHDQLDRLSHRARMPYLRRARGK
ncbi:hypothetical protein [Gimesia algae]|nr:hypothetical protein [Gimesia algae]